MPIVSFWNPVESAQASTTSCIAAVSAMLPAKCKYRTLVTQTHYSDFSLESAFFNMENICGCNQILCCRSLFPCV